MFSKIGIIADDLTGANDTALQFHLKGCKTEIILDYENFSGVQTSAQVLAIPTESRNIDAHEACSKVRKATEILCENVKIDYFYKKIDSTLRGNIAPEVLTMLDVIKWDAAIVLPAFPVEGRTTVGGYHLLKGIPIQRTELARDPHSPIFESYLPGILAAQLPDEYKSLIAKVPLDVVMKGAGPILTKINSLVEEGKKVIVVDAVSTVDVEQVALAITKSAFKILPCGSAGLAQALGKVWFRDFSPCVAEFEIPQLPKLIISGSATDLSASQIKRLHDDDNIDNSFFIPITIEHVVNKSYNEVVERAITYLVNGNTVVVHSSDIVVDKEKLEQFAFEQELSLGTFITEIADFLAVVTRKIFESKHAILVLVGGETSFKCSKALGSRQLELLDSVTSAIPLCKNSESQFIVTKSGNLGNANTLVDIINYFNYDK